MMKIAVINSSPKGKDSNTNVMVEAFLKGAQAEGAEAVNIFLAEQNIEHCKGCHICWSRGPAQCVTSDDMLKVLAQLGGADVIVFATPVYFENISGMLKVFMDRMTMIGGPSSPAAARVAEQPTNQAAAKAPKLMMISNCGNADKAEFQVVSLWMQRVALKMRMELIGEIYTGSGRYLGNPTEEWKPAIENYLKLLEQAGREVAVGMKLSEETKKALEQGLEQ